VILVCLLHGKSYEDLCERVSRSMKSLAPVLENADDLLDSQLLNHEEEEEESSSDDNSSSVPLEEELGAGHLA